MKQYKYNINGDAFDVTIKSINGSTAKVEVNGLPMEVEMLNSELSEEQLPDHVDNPIQTTTTNTKVVEEVEKPKTDTLATGEGSPVVAPLPGLISKVVVEKGQKVKKGDTVVVLEAMKMENNITTEQDGEVTGIAVRQGDNVMEGAVLVTIK